MCNFVVVWKHGPVAGCLANRKIENICRPQSTSSVDPNVAGFVELVRKKLQAEHTDSLPTNSQSFLTSQSSNVCVTLIGFPGFFIFIQIAHCSDLVMLFAFLREQIVPGYR